MPNKKQRTSINNVTDIDEQVAKLNIQKSLEIEKAFKSGDVNQIYKAQAYLNQFSANKNGNTQSLIVDPQSFGSAGYKEKSYTISYSMLRSMARTTIVKPIIKTRIEQVLEFMTPQKDKYSKGFIIRPKKYKMGDDGIKLTKEQEYKIEAITEFLLNCGDRENKHNGDNLDSFTKKFIGDLLALDQATFELVRNRGGELVEFLATDAATFRLADHAHTGALQKPEKDGQLPKYVQVYQGKIEAEFYPWELCFTMRNPQTDIHANGYGRSELEDLIENVTSMLNAEKYNSNYFKVGSNPKGILKVTGNVNNNRIEEFRNMWQAQLAGVQNSHKLAIIEADKMDFINTQGSNKDMEYGLYNDFLTKVTCAHYVIDPSEIGFPMNGGSENQGGLGGNSGVKERLNHSKSKGLNPLLKSYQTVINENIVDYLDDGFEFIFQGMDARTPEQELEEDMKAVTAFMTPNEIRKRRGLKPIKGGDIILNPIFLQQQMMQQEQSNQAMEDEENKDNPFVKALENDIDRIFAKDI